MNTLELIVEHEIAKLESKKKGFCSFHQTDYIDYCPECSTEIMLNEETSELTERWRY